MNALMRNTIEAGLAYARSNNHTHYAAVFETLLSELDMYEANEAEPTDIEPMSDELLREVDNGAEKLYNQMKDEQPSSLAAHYTLDELLKYKPPMRMSISKACILVCNDKHIKPNPIWVALVENQGVYA